ncbi:transposase [Pasteurella skyensis]|uniref:Transposase n=1 Tax=Phocoenobacter skyensis TaxID=97481 RepID=A0AAJ6N9E8_9PAST|nr:transposase [Pasteurella skyensis]MDP8162832.1 transposase [Pasteurella skyensis]MDP8172581.1 transposase [Pasteurella skyensis]MDP8179081.1 transposase [Pasteurella skyensis]MDP8183234.1 transposase [Pasteurella skyensis]MDP8189285.1 transposase [Pasteurella skyensis]
MAILPSVLAEFAKRIDNAGFGKKETVITEGVALTGLSRATFLKKVAPFRSKTGRKTRVDKGKNQLERAELELISSAWLFSRRANGKTMMTLDRVLEMLRANNKIKAEYVDPNTGEVCLYSASAVNRALKNANLHPDQLSQPSPVQQLQSLHPNHVWQIDPSLCVLYYLTEQGDGGNGLNVMEADQFYKNKPANVAKIERQRVWRYVITDHTSGVIYVEYVYGGETAENISHTFINAIQKKGRFDEPFYGVPKLLMMDAGSANTSAMFKHLLHQLNVEFITNKPGNPRAKGQVEKGNDIVERQFESGLRFSNVSGLDELNALAHQWMRYFNTHKIHSRTKMSRYKAWLHITKEQLICPPSIEICQELMVTGLVERVVSDKLEIKFEGKRYDVTPVPDVKVGEKIKVGKNPYRPDCVQVECCETLEDNKERLFWVVLEPVELSEFGFRTDAAIIGEEYKSQAKTVFEQNKETVEQLAYGVETQEDVKKAQKSNKVLFDGQINPYKHIEETDPTLFMPRRGQEHSLTTNARRVEQKPISLVECAKQLKAKFPDEWNAKQYKAMAKDYPDGVPFDVLESWLALDFLGEEIAPETKVIKLQEAC